MKKFSFAVLCAASSICCADQQIIADSVSTAPTSGSYHPMDDEMYGIHFSGEALYWKAMVQAGSIAIEENAAAFPVPSFSTVKTPINWSFDWNWGFRINGGFRFDDYNWGVNMTYTQFYTHAGKSQSAPVGQYLTILNNPFSSSVVKGSDVVARFDNKMNVLEGVLERRYDVGEHLAFYPALGVKGVWFRQKSRQVFAGGDIATGAIVSQKENTKYSAAGPKVALASRWNVGCGFGFFENFGVSLLVGNSKRSANQSYVGSYSNVNSYSVFEMVPAIEMQLGADYQYHFEDVAQSIGINVGVDGQTFLNEYYSPESGLRGNNSYFGLSLGAFWNF